MFFKVRTLRRIRISLGSVDGVKSGQTAFSATGMTVRAGPYRSPVDELEHDELGSRQAWPARNAEDKQHRQQNSKDGGEPWRPFASENSGTVLRTR